MERCMANLRLERVSKQYDTTSWGVRSIDLRVEDGELLAIVGASGSGKSTLLRIIAGLERPCAGEVFLDGSRVTDVPPWDRDVGLVSDAASLLPHLTVAENLEWSRRQRRRRKVRQESDGSRSGNGGTEGKIEGDYGAEEPAVVELGELLGLTGLFTRRPAELSAGQQQRVALGRALASRPRVLLLDEPLGRIDGPGRQSLAWELKRVQRSTRTTWIYVTHDRREAVAVADRVAVLDDGRLLQVGTERELRERPRDLKVMAWWWDGWLSGLAGTGEMVGPRRRKMFRFRSPQLSPHGLDIDAGTDAGIEADVDAGVRSEIAVPGNGQAVVDDQSAGVWVVGVDEVAGRPAGDGGRPRPMLAVWPSEQVVVRFDRLAACSNGEKLSGEVVGRDGVAGAVATSSGQVVERRDWEDKAWALVALDPPSGVQGVHGALGSGDWELSFASALARGWVWGRIRNEGADTVELPGHHSAKIDVGTQVVVEFDSREARCFDHGLERWDERTSQG